MCSAREPRVADSEPGLVCGVDESEALERLRWGYRRERVAIDENGFIAALKEVAATLVTPVGPLSENPV